MPRGNSYIRERRIALGLTQVELAVKADVSTRTVQFAEKGDRFNTRKSMELIAMALGVEYDEIVQPENSTTRDALYEWPWSLSKFVRDRILPEESAYCLTEEDAANGIKQMRDSWELHLDLANVPDHDGVYQAADQLLDEQFQAYQARYLALWRKNKSVIHFATLNSIRSGISVVLPVSSRAYQSLRSGKVSFMDIGENDIEPKSQSLVLDSAVEFSNPKTKPWYKITDALSLAVFYQISILSQNPAAKNFRMLSFGASPINIKRLESTGFRSSGVVMPEFGYQVCEFTNDYSDLQFESFAAASTLSHFARLFKAFVPPEISLRAKRRIIARVLRTYQQVVASFKRSDSELRRNTAA